MIMAIYSCSHELSNYQLSLLESCRDIGFLFHRSLGLDTKGRPKLPTHLIGLRLQQPGGRSRTPPLIARFATVGLH